MNELQHHGIRGMKWGVRRFQNYDGSRTKEGLNRYREVDTQYQNAKEKKKTAYKNRKVNREEYQVAKRELKNSERQLKEAYRKLTRDNLADEGEKLVRQGKTFVDPTSFAIKEAAVLAGCSVGIGVVSGTLAKHGNEKLAGITAKAAWVAALTNCLTRYYNANLQNEKLEAYVDYEAQRALSNKH